MSSRRTKSRSDAVSLQARPRRGARGGASRPDSGFPPRPQVAAPAVAPRGGRAGRPVEPDVARLFAAYGDPDGGSMRADGVCRLLDAVGVDPDDVAVLAFAYECGAATACAFSYAEFARGMAALGASSLPDLARGLERLRASVAGDAAYRARLYDFAFPWSLDPPAKRLPAEVAGALWKLLLGAEGWPLTDAWIAFACGGVGGGDAAPATQSTTTVSRDLWTQTLQFARSVAVDMANFDGDGAWPSALDSFAARVAAASRAGAPLAFAPSPPADTTRAAATGAEDDPIVVD